MATRVRAALLDLVFTERPAAVRALIREPGKINRLIQANENAREAFGDPFEDVVPEWMRERLGWTSRFTFGGSPIVVGVESPVTDLNKFIKVGGPGDAAEGFASEVTSALSPVIKAPVELALGVNTFTGAPFSEGGVEAPDWYRMLPGVPKRTDARGRTMMPEWLAQTVRNTLPPVGQLDRAFGLSPSSRERLPTSIISQVAPIVSTSTLTPRQKAGELYLRSRRLSRDVDWSGVDTGTVELAGRLLDEGYTPGQVRRLLTRAGRL